MRAELDAAIATRTHVDVGRRVRAIDRDNVGHVLSIDDDAGACLVQFDSIDGRTAIKTLDWSQLVVIDHPDTVEITPAAAATLARRTDAVLAAESDWAAALAEHGVRARRRARRIDAPSTRPPTTLPERSKRTRPSGSPPGSVHDPPPRPQHPSGTTPSPASPTTDSSTTSHKTSPGSAHAPPIPIESDRWQDLMLRLLEDRLWLADHSTPEMVPLPAATPQELIDRRAELEQLLATAPADQQQFIDRIARSELDPTEMHEYLSAAMAVQDERREWILTNWPHLVELEQVTALIAEQEPLAHWPVTQPAEVRDVLDQLRQLAPTPRHQRGTLARRTGPSGDRVRPCSQARSPPHTSPSARRAGHPDRARSDPQRARHAEPRPPSRTTVTNDQRSLRPLRTHPDRRRPRYPDHHPRPRHPHEPAGVDHRRDPQPPRRKASSTPVTSPTLATRITHAVVHQDRHGHLPEQWIDLSPAAPEPSAPSIEVGR